jgi:hypothetical protein
MLWGCGGSTEPTTQSAVQDGGVTGTSTGASGPSVTGGSQAGGAGSPSPPQAQAGNCPLVPPSDPGNGSAGCVLVGSWVLNSSHGDVRSLGVIQFDADGAYYGGPPGTDLSQTYAYDGSYSVAGSTFTLAFSCGDGCNGSGTFDMQFQNDCAVAILNERLTQCTGNRIAVAGNVVLTRR